MPQLIQPSFAKGELSPSLYGRVDTAAYQVGLKTARNTIIHPYGGVSSRSGMEYIGPAADHDNTPRLIPFEFKTDDQYILEFGDQYMRVIRNEGFVTTDVELISSIATGSSTTVTTTTHTYEEGDEIVLSGLLVALGDRLNNRHYHITNITGTKFTLLNHADDSLIDTSGLSYSSTVSDLASKVYKITTPWSIADVFDLTFVQNADVMTICHKDYQIRELTRTDHDAWTISIPVFAPELHHGGGQTVTVNPATGVEIESYRVTAHANETLEESLPFLNNTTIAITSASTDNPVVLTTATHGFASGDEIHIEDVTTMTEINERRFIITVLTSTTFELDEEDGTTYTAGTGGNANQTFVTVTDGNTTPNNTIAWTALADTVKYSVYRRSNSIYGLIGEATDATFDDENITPDLSITPPSARNPFRGVDNYPGAVSYYQQRRVFGGSRNNPDRSYFSQVGNPSNFTVSIPTAADDAITASLTSRQVNEIRQYIPGNDLVTFTSGSEWRLNAGVDSVLSPDTLTQKPQTAWGSSYREPLQVGQTIMFVTPEENGVRSLGYSFQSDAYTGTDMLIFANHLLEDDTVKDWCITRSPETRLHLMLASGSALSFTFDQEQEVIAWTTWDTDGSFESTASLRGGGDSNEDSVYVVVKRTINGNVVRYIELWRQRFFNNVKDCFFIDSGLSLDNPVSIITDISSTDPVVVTTGATLHNFADGTVLDFSDVVWTSSFDSDFNETIPSDLNGGRYITNNATPFTFELTSFPDGDNIDGTEFSIYNSGGTYREPVSSVAGLSHLEGEAVVGLADGNVITDLTVTNGSVTLPRIASIIHLGLRYIVDIETLNIESPQGTTQGQEKKVNRVVVRFLKSRGLLIGPSSDKLQEMKQREFEVMGAPTELLTGDKKIFIKPDWNTNGRIFMRQVNPLPTTILAVIPHLTAGDDE